MAIFFWDSFENYPTTSEVSDSYNYLTQGKWTQVATSGGGIDTQGVRTVYARTGLKALGIECHDYLAAMGITVAKAFSDTATIAVGFGAMLSLYNVHNENPGGVSNTYPIARLLNSTTEVIGLLFNPVLGRVELEISGAVVASSSNGSVSVGVWKGFGVEVDGANQTVKVWVDNKLVITETGVGPVTVNVLKIGLLSSEILPGDLFTLFYDDLYLDDAAYQGDIRMEPMRVDGAGDVTQLTANGAATNWECVDETSPDDATTYVSGGTSGLNDLYTLEAFTSTASEIVGVAIEQRAYKDAGGDSDLKGQMKLGGVTTESAAMTLSAGQYIYADALFTTRPGGGAWAPADLAGLQIGPKLA